MKIIKREKKLCLSCMEEHEVKIVILEDKEIFKEEEVLFNASYEYCDHTEEFLENEEMIRANNLAMKDSYRETVGLLTSREIIGIREKYSVSQKDFAEILGWGGATITRYENYQVQSSSHDDVLRKIDSDPQWFLKMLNRARGKISDRAYNKYYKEVNIEFGKLKNNYLIDSIQALYANLTDDIITGGVELNLNKVIESINYYASRVSILHKVKLMKMLWYEDNVSYKRRGKSITGLVYKALPMGAVPIGYEQILNLEGIEYETVVYDDYENIAYRFQPAEGFKVNEITKEELEILDTVIAEVGHLNSQEIIDKMHEEDAYKCTEKNCIISFSYSKDLSVN